jgi:ABC-2 type transport system ATP-binding protein
MGLWRGLGAAFACVVLLLCSVAPAGAFRAERRDADLPSFDGVRIRAHFFPAPKTPAPTVMLGHGWSGWGELEPSSPVTGTLPETFDDVGVAELLNAGYNVLTWDARGFGRSDGAAEVDSPAYEGRDAQMLIDWIATQPEALLDGPGDPRLGMAGASYGGGIQYVTAGMDRRVDAITPTIAWHDLSNALFPEGDLRAGWASLLLTSGHTTGTPRPSSCRCPSARWPRGACRNGRASTSCRAARAASCRRSPRRRSSRRARPTRCSPCAMR